VPGSLVGGPVPTFPEADMVTTAQRLFSRGTWADVRRIGDILRTETIGGLVLLGATTAALVWANSPWSAGYQALSTGTGVASLRWGT
jgi:Na+:H+ antiporter, NhaA family